MRSFTRRPKVIKFETGYHGHGDPFQTDGKVTAEMQDADGVPASVKGVCAPQMDQILRCCCVVLGVW